MTDVIGDSKKDESKDAKKDGKGGGSQVWPAVITGFATIVVGCLGLYGTLRVTDSRIVTGPEVPGPTVTRTVTVAPTATVTETVDPNGDGGGDGSLPTAAKTALDVNWTTNARDYNSASDIGLIVQFDCPSRGIAQRIYGDGVYRGDSSVCTAGVHDGRISLAKGGRLMVQIREGAQSYPATRRNGITSREFNGSYPYSFEFLPPRSN